MNRLTLRSAAAGLAMAIVLASLFDCSSAQHKSRQGSASDSSHAVSANQGAAQPRSLHQLAAAERSSRSTPADVALPPGIEPGVLALRPADDKRAFLSLSKALDELSPVAAASTESGPATHPQATPDQQAAALKAYAKGRNAALDNRHLQAVIEFQKALAIDPDSPEILRELARSYDAAGNQQRAYETLERLAQVSPNDVDAMFALGVAAATRREFETSARYLGRLQRTGNGSARDPGMSVIIDFTLATSLRELGYDRAFIELAERVVDMPQHLAAAAPSSRIASVYRQRGDLWRSAGDAHARLGEIDKALDAWRTAAALPSADPSALAPRVIYGNLRVGRRLGAQAALLDSLSLSATAGSVSDREVRLCAYIAEHAKPVDRLADEVLSLQQAHPDDSGCVRAAAMLLPDDRAMTLLRDFIDRQPSDVQALSQLMSWLQKDDASAAAALTVTLATTRPERADDYADAFGQSSPGYSAAVKAMRSQKPSAAQAAVLSRLLSRAGSLGESWDVCQEALKQWPQDRALRLRVVQLAAAMQEPALVSRAIANCADVTDAAGLITLSQARRSLGQTTEALELANRAASNEPQNVAAQVEVARAHHAHAVVLASDPANAPAARAGADAAIVAANAAIELDPARDDAYETLALIYGPGGVLADTQELRSLLLRLRQANAQSPLYNRLAAQDAMSQRRFDQALERLINACDGNPADGQALALAVAVWDRAGKLDAAEAWLRERLTQRPSDGLLREQLLRVQVLRGEQDRAVAELEQQVKADPEDHTAKRLLEGAYRVTSQNDAALELGEQRLLARPEGVRREIELAALYAGAERADPALERLERVRDMAADALAGDLNDAMTIAGRVKGADQRRDALMLDLAHIAIERQPDAPLQVYGQALRAIARQEQRAGTRDERFESLVREAIAKSAGAADASFQGARLWQEFAQALVADDLPAAAARALRVRLGHEPLLEGAALAALARIVIVIDAETVYQAGPEDPDKARPVVERTLALLSDMQQRQLLQRMFDTQTPIDLAQAQYESSTLYTLVGAEGGAELLMRESLKSRPDEAMTLNNLGYMLLERGATGEEVTRMINQAGRLQPEESNILDTVGWLRYKQGRLNEQNGHEARNAGDPDAGAVALIQKALDTSNDPSAEVFDHLGDAKWRLGDEEGAVAAWKRVVTMIDDGSFRDRLLQNIAALQARQWGIIVMDGERLYDREYAPVLKRAQEKIEAATRGEQPAVAPQWAVEPSK